VHVPLALPPEHFQMFPPKGQFLFLSQFELSGTDKLQLDGFLSYIHNLAPVLYGQMVSFLVHHFAMFSPFKIQSSDIIIP